MPFETPAYLSDNIKHFRKPGLCFERDREGFHLPTPSVAHIIYEGWSASRAMEVSL